jgi:osmoprotectant transport system permease protein
MSAAFDWLTKASQWSGDNGIPMRLLEHAWYSAVAVAIALVIALPVGLAIGHTSRFTVVTATMSNVWRALPTLGVVILVFRLAPLSIWPVLAALVIIAIPPILLNAEAGIRAVNLDVRDAARAMGMTGWQALWRVEVPLALSVIVAGLRSATGQVVATASIAAYVGLGGLGRYLIDGYAARDTGEIVGGSIVLGAVALAVEGAFAVVQRAVNPRRATPRPLFLPTPQPKEFSS